MNNGWIKLHRQFLEWEWYRDINTKILFLHLLLSANFEEKKWMGQVINKGQYVTSIQGLSGATGLSVRAVRTCLNKLRSTGEISVKTTNKFTILTICKYASYQSIQDDFDIKPTIKRQTTDKQPTNNRQTTDNQTTTTKEGEEGKKDKKGRKGGKFEAPTISEVVEYFEENGYTVASAERAFKYYETGNWIDSKGNQVKNWKQKMQAVWFKPENKSPSSSGLVIEGSKAKDLSSLPGQLNGLTF